MIEGLRVGAILLMGGEGVRFGGQIPKQFRCLGQKKIYLYPLEVLKASRLFDEILLVCHRDWIEIVKRETSVRVVEGGKTRQESSYRGLLGFDRRPDVVLIHDAVRPFVNERILKENVEQAIVHGAVDTCIPTADTLVHAPGGQLISHIPKREEYLRGQTPQTFRTDWIMEAHERALKEGIENASDDCRLVLHCGHPVKVVIGEERNLKITSEFDLLLAEQMT